MEFRCVTRMMKATSAEEDPRRWVCFVARYYYDERHLTPIVVDWDSMTIDYWRNALKTCPINQLSYNIHSLIGTIKIKLQKKVHKQNDEVKLNYWVY